MLLASIDNKCKKFIRVSTCQRIEIQRVLELSPDGILVPQISSYEEALAAINYTFYSPIGTRGLSPYTRGFNFNHSNLSDKKIKINKELSLGLLIEGKSGFDALPLILENLSSNLDLIYFGLFDFASSQGIDPDWDNKLLIKLLADTISAAKKKNISVGTIARTKKDLEILNNMGVTYIVYLNDLGILNEAMNEI